MAKSKRHLSRRKKVTKVDNMQVVYSEPRKVFKEKYLSPKGEELLSLGLIEKKEAWKKYGKNRYTVNPKAKPVNIIFHQI